MDNTVRQRIEEVGVKLVLIALVCLFALLLGTVVTMAILALIQVATGGICRCP